MLTEPQIHHLRSHVQFILKHYNRKSHHVSIHIQKQRSPDYARMSFVLYTLSRLSLSPLVSQLNLDLPSSQDISTSLLHILSHPRVQNNEKERRYVELYGIRAFTHLHKDPVRFIDSFARGSYSTVLEYPVSTYLLLSAHFESEDLRVSYPYSDSLKEKAISVLEYLLYSSQLDQYKAFHFAEMSAWYEYLPTYLQKHSKQLMRDLFKKDITTQASYSSGITKSLEHFARIGDQEYLSIGLSYLNERSLRRFESYLQPDLRPFLETIYTEQLTSQYICLDTSAHLIHAYLNLYDRK